MKTKPLQWFLSRIGKRIYRNSCPTHEDEGESCCKNYKEGLIVGDEGHAHYLHMIENDYAAGGNFLNYRDKP